MAQSKTNADTTTMAKVYIGPYKLLGEIGQDEVGQLFEAVDLLRKRRVVIKHLRPAAGPQHEIEPRLFSEADTLTLLNHPHIARLFGFVRRDDQLYLVMESVEGESLQAVLKEKGRFEPSVAMAFFYQILSAVGFAHRLGVIHGDLKPANIMLTKLGIIKVLNFPIAPILGNPRLALLRASNVRYVAPEQSAGEPGDVRSDVYSLVILLYEMIVGNVPFDGASDEEVVKAKTETTPLLPSLAVPELPNWLDAVVLRALSVSPSDRFRSVTELTQAISAPPAVAAGAAWPNSMRVRVRRSAERLASACNSLSIRSYRSLGILQRTVGMAIAISHQRLSHWARPLWRAPAASHSAIWTNFRIQWPRPAFRPASLGSKRLVEPCRKILGTISEAGWKRHAVFTFVLGALLIEIFVFAGANTLLRPAKPILNSNTNNVVEDLFPKIDSARMVNETRNSAEAEPRSVEKSTSARPKTMDSRTGAVRTRQAQASQRAAEKAPQSFAVSVSEKPVDPPAFQQPRANKPPYSPRATPENNSVGKQLNVKWEN